MAEPAGTDPAAEPQGGAQGSPDLKAENTRLNTELKAANEKVTELQKQIEDLNSSLEKALTEEDVEAAVKKAQEEAEEILKASRETWDEDRKRLTVENALISAGCTDTIGCMAHLDLEKVDIAADGHISGLDVKTLAKEHPHLFAEGGNTGTVASAAEPGGPAKTMTREEIMKETDPAKRRKLISGHMDLFE